MKIDEFLDFFDFRLKRYENKYGVIDKQGVNLGDIEAERFDSLSQIVDRFSESIYIYDYIDRDLEEEGYDGNGTYESQYNWCMKNNHPYKDIIYVFLHPETIQNN